MAETFPELKITLILIKASPSVKCQRICLTDIGNVIQTLIVILAGEHPVHFTTVTVPVFIKELY